MRPLTLRGGDEKLAATPKARPVFAGVRPSPQRIYVLNGILAGVLLGAFLILSFALGGEIYRCEVLAIPNCD